MNEQIINFKKALVEFEKAAISLDRSSPPIGLEEYERAENEVVMLYIKALTDGRKEIE